MCDLAQSFDLKAKATKISEKELIKLLSKKQQILRLKNGRYIIALRVIQGEKDDDKSVLCLDTGVTSPKPQQINLKELKKGWDGEVILLKAKLKKFEEDSELKIGWLIGESFRNKSVMVQVVIVALILNIFAVIPAVFMMLVLDKVVNYEAYSTLYVITSGVVVAYVFNGILGYLKSYLLDFFSQKVEAKLSVKVFEKLIALPMQRFHKESATFLRFTGQISQIKSLLTQKVFSTALDSISLLVFVPILFFYSPLLFIVVFSFSILESKDNPKDPHDDDLRGKNLICYNDSLSVEDWGIKFLKNNKVKMYSLNKAIYEIYQYNRKYRTNIRNIIISKNNKIEFIINRSRLVLGNKSCKIVLRDPLILLQERIKSIKEDRKEKNRI